MNPARRTPEARPTPPPVPVVAGSPTFTARGPTPDPRVRSHPRRAVPAWIAALGLVAVSALSARGDVSFRNQIMPVLSKAGCNTGPCHGNQNGKASFKLSLRGEDPEWDHRALTRDMLARRVDLLTPADSLILLKATTALAHEGGLRFPHDSEEYRLVRDWIAAGASDDGTNAPTVQSLQLSFGDAPPASSSKPSPAAGSGPLERILIEPTNTVTLSVRATFSDGAEQDVTRLAVYEPSATSVKVTPEGRVTLEEPGEVTVIVRFLQQQVPVRLALAAARPGFVWSRPDEINRIDRDVFAKLRALRLNPSALCSDSVFVRRVSLDLLGLLPTAAEARAFCADPSPDKRERWVERLLDRPEFAEWWALKLSDVLRNEEKVLDRKGVQGYSDWLRSAFAQRVPLDRVVRELIAARGSTYANPAANFYRANRDATTRSEAIAQVFLGTRLQCARCHNHPFDRWTQADYYDWADVFARIRYKVLENRRRDGLDSHEFVGDQIIYLADDGGMTNARTGLRAHARYLGEASPAASAAENAPEETELDRAADWLVRHPNFARAQVNWVWSHLMGRGLVEPVDDFRPTNPATHPQLLQSLAEDFARHGFDLRWLIRFITRSRTYQLASEPNDTNAGDTVNYSHALPRRLTAEQLFDAQHRALDVPARFRGFPDGLRAAQIPGGSPVRRNEATADGAEKFLATFGKPARLLACECERSNETTLGQTLQLISGPDLDALLTSPDNRVGQLLASDQADRDRIEELYWTALSRAPAPVELTKALALLRDRPPAERRQVLEDLAWSLLNAKEFLLRP